MTGSLIAALSLGLLGSFHCVGMCGPIALALPVHQLSPFKKITAMFSYNFGRAVTYSVIGLLFGAIGKGFSIFSLQQILSVVLGSIILLSVLLPSHIIKQFSFTNKFYLVFNYVKSKIGRLIQNKSAGSLFLIGLLNGLLPCGMVYIALAGAMATGNELKGALFMAVFGLGTFPLMLSLTWFSDLISIKFRTYIRTAVPYLISVMAILMILRGMNLGIPYVSPKLETMKKAESGMVEQKLKCCHK